MRRPALAPEVDGDSAIAVVRVKSSPLPSCPRLAGGQQGNESALARGGPRRGQGRTPALVTRLQQLEPGPPRLVPAAAARLAAVAAVTTVRARYFPAQVLLPGLGVWSRTYVLLADDGLHVFRRTGEVAQWHQAVDWSRMPGVLPSAREGRNGITVHLADGTTAVLTTGGGCGCGSPLRHWAGPSWGNRVRVG